MNDSQPVQEDYDDSPWTDEEMLALADEDADFLGWDGFDAYQEELEPSA